MKLDDLNQQHPDNVGRRESIRLDEQCKFLKESRAPQTGIYWWCPTKNDWRLAVFFDEEFGNPWHKEIWEKWCATILGLDDVRVPSEVAEAYHGLPRGRVSLGRGVYVILHGNDTPIKNGLELVAKRFNLPPGYHTAFDSHEVTLQDDVKIIKNFQSS